jgi:NADH-quinone oxidoreductase subunit G
MRAAHPVFARIDEIVTPVWASFGEDGPVDPAPFTCPIADFYRTDPISRASPTMAECSDAFGVVPGTQQRTGTHG